MLITNSSSPAITPRLDAPATWRVSEPKKSMDWHKLNKLNRDWRNVVEASQYDSGDVERYAVAIWFSTRSGNTPDFFDEAFRKNTNYYAACLNKFHNQLTKSRQIFFKGRSFHHLVETATLNNHLDLIVFRNLLNTFIQALPTLTYEEKVWLKADNKKTINNLYEYVAIADENDPTFLDPVKKFLK